MGRYTKITSGAFLTLLLFFPLYAGARVSITEIMYDAEGGDAGKEWIEVHNDGQDQVDISTWRLFEADTNHKMTVISGDGVIAAGGYALIVSDIIAGFSGDILDSSFSLSNTGETISLRDSELNDVDSVSYSSEWGAKGDGRSLQNVDGTWMVGTPTPGEENEASLEVSVVDDDTADTSVGSSVATAIGGATTFVEPKAPIIAYAGVRKRIAVAGARTIFEGSVHTGTGEDLPLARFIWNFGDGTREEGKRVEHIYEYPGDHAVVLDAASGIYAAMDRVEVSVIAADVWVSRTGDESDPLVEITNGTKYELDLSGWKLTANGDTFVFPDGTFVLPGKKIVIGPKATGFLRSSGAVLRYPNGEVVENDHTSLEVGLPKTLTNLSQETVGNFLLGTGVVQSEAGGTVPSASLVKGSSEKAEEATPVADENDVATEDLMQGNIAQMAASPMVDIGSDDGLFWGLMGVALLALIGIYVVLDMKRVPYATGVKSEADLYKVIEIDDVK